MHKKILNPIYFWVNENLHIENEIAKERKDLNSFAITLLSSTAYTDQELRKSLNYLHQGVVENKFSLRYAIAISALLYFSSKRKISLPTSEKVEMQKIIESLYKKSPVPLKDKLISYYLSKAAIKLPEFTKYLENLYSEMKESKRLKDVVELEFSLGKGYYSKEFWENTPFEDLDFDLAALSKLGVVYLDNNKKERLSELANYIESLVWDKISATSLPEISLLVYEAEKLISTNLRSDQLQDVLISLKKQNKNWADLITKIEQDGVTVNINKISRLSGLTPEESVWTFILLEKLGLKETYQVNSEDYSRFEIYNSIPEAKKLPISVLSVQLYSGFVALLTLIGFLYAYFIGWDLLKLYSDYNNLLDIQISLEVVGHLRSPLIIIPLLIRTYFNARYYLVKTRQFSIKYCLLSWWPARFKV